MAFNKHQYNTQSLLLVFFLLLTILFFLNINHLGQQGIYSGVYIPLAEQLSNFNYSITNQIFDTYPMWGYPLVLFGMKFVGFEYQHIFYLQYILLVISYYLFFKKYSIENNTWLKNIVIFGLFIFYTAILSVKWPDAIVAFCLFMVGYFHINKKYLFAAIMLGIAYNFRTESLAFLLIYLIIIAWQYKKITPIYSLSLLIPWIVINYYHHQQLIPTTTNAGGVVYITLGQLPNNIWGREHKDGEAYNFIKNKLNSNNPWGLNEGKMLKEQFIDDIANHPIEFGKKVIYNFANSIIRGFYAFEYIPENLLNRFKFYKQNIATFLQDIIYFNTDAIIILLAKILSVLSNILLIIVFFMLYRSYNSFLIPLFVLILLQFAIVAFIQYETRHISKIIGIMLFIFAFNKKND
jgi:hypothetical protein